MTDQNDGPRRVGAGGRGIRRTALALTSPEHTHIPLSRHNAPPPTPASPKLPEEYKRNARFRSSRLRDGRRRRPERILIGTGICPRPPTRSDHHCQGKSRPSTRPLGRTLHVRRIGFRLGTRDEIATHGVAMKERRDIARENVLAMQAFVARRHRDIRWRVTCTSRRRGAWPEAGAASPVRPVLIGGAAGPKLFAQRRRVPPMAGSRSAAPAYAAAMEDLARRVPSAARSPNPPPRRCASCRFRHRAPIPARIEYYAVARQSTRDRACALPSVPVANKAFAAARTRFAES